MKVDSGFCRIKQMNEIVHLLEGYSHKNLAKEVDP